MFLIIELLFTLFLIFMIGNVLRYFFMKGEKKGGVFFLSDAWIEQDEKKKQQSK